MTEPSTPPLRKRFRQARGILGLTEAEMAAVTQLPVDDIKAQEETGSDPTPKELGGYLRAGINGNWLLTGKGPMLAQEFFEMLITFESERRSTIATEIKRIGQSLQVIAAQIEAKNAAL